MSQGEREGRREGKGGKEGQRKEEREGKGMLGVGGWCWVLACWRLALVIPGWHWSLSVPSVGRQPPTGVECLPPMFSTRPSLPSSLGPTKEKAAG
jgi:hypothetical protein